MKYIKATSVDKVNGKLVKYKKGDCLSIDCGNGKYIAAFISEKFNKYYDLTLIEYCERSKPTLDNFKDGRFWGTHSGSFDELAYAVDKKMILCSYIDNNDGVSMVGNLPLIEDLLKAGYSGIDNLAELFAYYDHEIPIRIEKTKNAERYPELSFYSKHLVEMKKIIVS